MRKPTPEDHARRMKAFREANKRWPLPVSGTVEEIRERVRTGNVSRCTEHKKSPAKDRADC